MNPEKLLSLAQKEVSLKYPSLKANKKREIVRLVFDIAKIKKDFSFLSLEKSYASLKKKLIKIRYPLSFSKIDLNRIYLPYPEFSDFQKALTGDYDILPEKIFWESSAENSELLKRLKDKFPKDIFKEIKTLKESKSEISAPSYSLRKKHWVIFKQKSGFAEKCPCTQGCLSCGYFNMNLGFGCPYECSYCYLQGYQNINAILLPYNIKDFFDEFDKKFSDLKSTIRIGSGEFSDSLALDSFTQYSKNICDFFSGKKNVVFEFKTKSAQVENIFKYAKSENIAVSFSLAPKEISEKEEFLCSGVNERISAMKKLSQAGIKTAFHLDPIVFSQDFEPLYENLLEKVFSSVNGGNISWISLGSFRFARETFKIMEKRFPVSSLLEGEMFLDFDGKLRYPFDIRKKMYSFIVKYLLKKGVSKNKIYLCMENKDMWDALGITPDFSW
ncbi:MAG: hypothetical protein GX447_05050 [Elusimicrobia bacterium]|nr:hypothetical protein [Elusimicrobiota bacterium]